MHAGNRELRIPTRHGRIRPLFQAFVLERAALDAGAHHVDFDPPRPRSRGG